MSSRSTRSGTTPGVPLPSLDYPKTPQDPDFVPMAWGGKYPDEVPNQIAEVQAYANGETLPVILGFNEPDNVAQSDMTVKQALSLWPEAAALALEAVSP